MIAPRRQLGAWAATAVVVSEVVGVGILLTPATMMRSLGGVWPPVALWLAMGALTTAGALCYAELATRFPRAGGAYVFLREGFGRRCAFVYGWMAMLVMDPGITAALAIGLAQYTLALTSLPARGVQPVAVAAIVGFALLATRGAGVNARALRWAAVVKLTIVAVLAAAGARLVFTGTTGAAPSPAIVGASGLASATIAAFFAFGGWWDLGRLSEEVESPRRTMPRALVGGVLLVTTIYMMVTVTFALAGPAAASASDEAFVAQVGAALFGAAAGQLLAAMVVVTVAGSLAAVLFGAPRTYFAMARDGILPLGGTWFDERRGSSPLGTLVQSALACVLVLLGSFDQILGYFIPAAVFFLGLSAAALLRIDRSAGQERVFRTPLYPLPLVLFLVLITTILVLFVAGQPVQTFLGAAVVLIGLVVSMFVVRR
jgi:APA family basic amino acid/polyamine antiporter